MSQFEYDNLSSSEKSEYIKSANNKCFNYGHPETGRDILEGLSKEEKKVFCDIVHKQADKGITMKIQFHIFDEYSRELINL